MFKSIGLGAAALWLVAVAQAGCPSIPSVQRFVANGAEVTDKTTGLVWARCSVGQTWDGGACTGTPTYLAHEAALAYAMAQSGWRLPNVKELLYLVDRGCSAPAIDSTVFPATPNASYWSSSPVAGASDSAWAVVFSSGNLSNGSRSHNNFRVRLVRISP